LKEFINTLIWTIVVQNFMSSLLWIVRYTYNFALEPLLVIIPKNRYSVPHKWVFSITRDWSKRVFYTDSNCIVLISICDWWVGKELFIQLPFMCVINFVNLSIIKFNLEIFLKMCVTIPLYHFGFSFEEFLLFCKKNNTWTTLPTCGWFWFLGKFIFLRLLCLGSIWLLFCTRGNWVGSAICGKYNFKNCGLSGTGVFQE